MHYLLLVRHSLPEIVPSEPAYQWRLSAEGRRRCTALASKLAAYAPGGIVSSVEPKAAETAQIIAGCLGMTYSIAEGLHEHERPSIDRAFDKQRFQAQVAQFFRRPQDLVMGAETADRAYQRFAGAVDAILRGNPGKDVVVVSHGTVISLFAARKAAIEPFSFWKELGLPALVILPLPGMGTVQVAQTAASMV